LENRDPESGHQRRTKRGEKRWPRNNYQGHEETAFDWFISSWKWGPWDCRMEAWKKRRMKNLKEIESQNRARGTTGSKNMGKSVVWGRNK